MELLTSLHSTNDAYRLEYCFSDRLLDVIHDSRTRNLRVIPSRFDFSDRLIHAVTTDERCLARLIANHFQDEDLIIIDCAPTESIFTQVAYHATRYILVPVRPEFFATIGFPLLKDSLEAFRRQNRGHQIGRDRYRYQQCDL